MRHQEENLYSPAAAYESTQIEVGTVGWADRDEHYEKGSGDNDGHTLVFVTLFRGADPSTKPEAGVARGMKILCHIPDGTYRIPKKGAKCWVAIPRGMEESPGAGVIIACVSPSPTVQFEEDRVVVDYGSDVHVVIKGLSVSLSDHASPARFLAVGTPRSGGVPGVQLLLPDGTGAAWQDGAFGIFVRDGIMVQATPSSFEVWQGTGSSGTFLKMGGGEFWTYGAANKVQGAGVYLGRAPTIANTAQWGPTGTASTASTGVFISPT